MEREVDKRTGAGADPVLTVMVNSELSLKAELLIFQFASIQTLIWSWVLGSDQNIETVNASGQNECSLPVDWVHTLEMSSSQLGWFGHLIRLAPWCLSAKVLQACPTRRRPQLRPRICWITRENCVWRRKRDVFATLLNLSNVALFKLWHSGVPTPWDLAKNAWSFSKKVESGSIFPGMQWDIIQHCTGLANPKCASANSR